MLNTGIVGIKNAEKYINAISKHPAYQFAGIFDPSFLTDNPTANPQNNNLFLTFDEMCCQCHALVFANDDKIYLPLIEKALRNSVAVFLESVQNFSIKELQVLQKLKDEARGILQIGHPYIYSAIFSQLKEKNPMPLDIECEVADNAISNLMVPLRIEVSGILTLVKANVKKVSVNIFSSFSEVPDMARIRIDFENGSVGNIRVSKYNIEPIHQIKAFGYDNLTNINFLSHQLTYIDPLCKNQPLNIDLHLQIKTNLHNQFDAFCSNIFGLSGYCNSIENEIKTQWVMERVKEKLRLSLNIF